MKINRFIVFVLAVLAGPVSGQVVSHPIAEDWESGEGRCRWAKFVKIAAH